MNLGNDVDWSVILTGYGLVVLMGLVLIVGTLTGAVVTYFTLVTTIAGLVVLVANIFIHVAFVKGWLEESNDY